MTGNNSKTGIIFDLDGTLWDSSYQVGIAWNLSFKRYGVDLELTQERMAVMMGRTVPEIGEILLPDIELERRNEILHACCVEENRRLNLYGGVLFDGVEELLPALAGRYELFIVSNCQDGYIQSFLNYHGFAKNVTDFECIGRTGLHKGDNITLIMERNGLAKAVYVGDTERDMHSAHSAGIPFIHASYGFGKGFAAERAISSFRELPELLDKLLKE